MKKLMLSLAAVAAFACSGAWAQGADCQAGAGWGTPPGCGNPSDAPGIVYGNTVQNNSGWPPANSPATPWGYYGYAVPGVLAQALPQYIDPATGYAYPQANRTRRDRDGDGVPNNRDRYPDDPRYR